MTGLDHPVNRIARTFGKPQSCAEIEDLAQPVTVGELSPHVLARVVDHARARGYGWAAALDALDPSRTLIAAVHRQGPAAWAQLVDDLRAAQFRANAEIPGHLLPEWDHRAAFWSTSSRDVMIGAKHHAMLITTRPDYSHPPTLRRRPVIVGVQYWNMTAGAYAWRANVAPVGDGRALACVALIVGMEEAPRPSALIDLGRASFDTAAWRYHGAPAPAVDPW